MRILRYAVVQAILGILIDGVLMAMAVYSASAQIALAILVLGCILALGFFLSQGWRSVGGGMVVGVGLYVVFIIVWYTHFCSGCGE